MKVTSLKEVESYIYCSVIQTLIGGSSIRMESPIKNHRGGICDLYVEKERVTSSFDHNYLRDIAVDDAPYIVVITDGRDTSTVAKVFNSTVHIYDNTIGVPSLVISKLWGEFEKCTMFNKIIRHNKPYARSDRVDAPF